MTTWAAFLRGVNVGGKRKIPMSDLRRICVGVTSDPDVRTYIASGNVMFTADGDAGTWATTIAAAIMDAFGFDVSVLVLDGQTLRAALAGCPYPADAGKAVHGYFCFDDPQIDDALIAALKTPTEDVTAQGRVVWLYAPDGIARSKLAAKMEKAIGGTGATARNMNTVCKMVEMLDA